MKALSALVVGGALLSLSVSSLSLAKENPLNTVRKAQLGRFNPGVVPDGYKANRVYRRERLKEPLLRFLAQLEAGKRLQWAKYVKETPEEFGDISKKKSEEIASDAAGYLGVRYLIEIDEVYKLWKGDEHIGYVYMTDDHVQAAIFQDGAGLDLYVDPDQNVITSLDWAS